MFFEIYVQPGRTLLAGEWRWRLKAANGQIIAQGESYVRKEDCVHAINLIKSTTVHTPVREV